MNSETFQNQLEDLTAKIDALPVEQRGPLLALVEETKRRQAELTKDVAAATDALADWRIAVKYAVFDREAARRESDR